MSESERIAELERALADARAKIAELRNRRVETTTLSHHFWNSLVEVTSNTVLFLDRKGIVRYLNRSLNGRPTAECLGKRLEEIIPPDPGGVARRQASAALQRVLEEGEQTHYVSRFERSGVSTWAHNDIGPIRRDNEVIGATVVLTDITETKRAEEELGEMARQLRRSQDELRRLGAHAQQLIEKERKAVAQEVHDEIGQYLVAMRMELELLRARCAHANAEDLQSLTRLERTLAHALQSSLGIQSTLRPSVLDNLGLADALEWLAQQYGDRYGLAVGVSLEGPLELAEHSSLALFRICEESLQNIACHAQAATVGVTLEATDGRVRLTVRDDGTGISEEALLSTESFGLLAMRERALACGGTLTVEPLPEGGTVVRATVPAKA